MGRPTTACSGRRCAPPCQRLKVALEAEVVDLKQRGLVAPSLAIGDGALGFWAAARKAFPATKHQGCTVHALRNALAKLPKKLLDHAKALLHEMFNAPTESEALKSNQHLQLIVDAPI